MGIQETDFFQKMFLFSKHGSVKAIVAAASITTALSLGSLGSLGLAPGTARCEALAAQTLQMGTEADFIPFEYRDEGVAGEAIVGFDIDVANYIAQQLGVSLHIQARPFDQLLPAVQEGSLDFVIAGLTVTPEREQLVDFSIPYFTSRQSLISARSHPVRTMTDTAGKRVIVQQGSVQEQLLLEQIESGSEIEIVLAQTLNEMVSAVRDLTVDAALVEEMVATAYLENNPMLVMDVLGELPTNEIAIAFPKGSPYVAPFNQVITDMQENGELQLIAQQWFTIDP